MLDIGADDSDAMAAFMQVNRDLLDYRFLYRLTAEKLRADKEVVLLAVQKYDGQLEFASTELRGDKEKLREFDDVSDANRRYRFMLEARRRYTTEGFEDGTYVPGTYKSEDEE